MRTHSPIVPRARLLLFLLALWTAPVPAGTALAQDSKENADFKLAVNLFNDGMYDLAAQQFRQFITAYPNTSQGIEGRFYLGLVQMKLKQYDDARTTFQNFGLSYVEHPRAAEAWLNVGHAFHALGNDREAALAYERVKVFHPNSPLVPEALLRAGEMHRNLGNREAAKQVLRSLIQSYPSSGQVLTARLNIGELYAEEGQIELAEEEARRVSVSGAAPEVRSAATYAMARFQITGSMFTSAESTLTALTKNFPGTPAARSAGPELARVELITGRPKSAVTRLQGVLASKNLPDSLRAEALMLMGEARSALGEFRGAEDSWMDLYARHPDHTLAPVARLRATDAALRDGRPEDVSPHLAPLLRDAPAAHRRSALFLSAGAALGMKRLNEASRILRQYRNEFPGDTASTGLLLSLGRAYRTDGKDCKNALKIFDQMEEEGASSRYADDALYEAARCEQELGDESAAVDLFTDLQTRFPANDRYEEVRGTIDFLEAHRIRNRDVGISKLAGLLGGVLSEKPTPMLAYQLGEIYFQDLKDYANAAAQFEAALKGGLDQEERINAAFLRARSYHLLSETDPGVKQTAAEQYAMFLGQMPQNNWSADAAYFGFQLALDTEPFDRLVQRGTTLLREYPASPHGEAVLMSLGLKALDHDQPLEAVRFFRTVLGAPSPSPRAAEARYYLATAFSAGNLPDSAAAAWETVVRDARGGRFTALAMSDLARYQISGKRYSEAAGLLRSLVAEFGYSSRGDEALRMLPGALLESGAYAELISLLGPSGDAAAPLPGEPAADPGRILLLAKAYDRAGDKEQAMRGYHLFLRSGGMQDPGASEAYYALGNLARLQGRTAAASVYFREASARGAEGAASAEIADLLFQSEQYAEAVRQFTHIADSSKDPAEQRHAAARAIVATLRLDRIDAAQKMISAFEKKFGKSEMERGEFEYEKGMIHYRRKEYTKAKDILDDVADDYGKSDRAPWAAYYSAKIAEVTGNREKALEGYREVVETYPGSDVMPRALLSIGNFHFNAERYEEAIRVYQQIMASPETAGDILPFAMTNLIEAYESVRLYENALQMTRDFIERFPNDETVISKKIRMGTLFTKIGYHDQAIFQFQNLLAEAGGDAEAELRYDIGEAYYYKGEYQQAILEFLKVPYLAAGKGTVDWTATSFYMAGQSYEKMMKFDEAIGMYQQIVDRPGIDPTFKAAARKEIDRVNLLNGKGKK